MRGFATFLTLVLSIPALAADKSVTLFNGKDFTGWEGDTAKTWKIEEGVIIGGSLDTVVPRNEFLCTTRTYGDFELKVVFKLTGDKTKANAGIQFRTKRIPKHHEVSGYQADMGQGYWGGLYDWVERTVLSHGKIGEIDMKLLYLTDEVDDAVKVVHEAYRAWEDTH